jgi:hypothetical protein
MKGSNMDKSTEQTSTAATKTEWWLLSGGAFGSEAARTVSGPYSTREDAFVARVTIERLRGAFDLWVDSREVPTRPTADRSE